MHRLFVLLPLLALLGLGGCVVAPAPAPGYYARPYYAPAPYYPRPYYGGGYYGGYRRW